MKRGLVVSAPSSGAGKTTVTLGLLRALRRRGHAVTSAKTGPDYIDPAFHAAATGHPCLTLDPWCADATQLRARAVGEGDLLVVEGAMGLFDGASGPATPRGYGSTADAAAALALPVILVIDAAKTAQTVAAIVAGLSTYRADVQVAGVILNRIGSPRHAAMIRAAVETVCPVLGAIPRAENLTTPSRHLGLVQAQEHGNLNSFIDVAADAIEAHCDLAALAALAVPVAPGTSSPTRLRPLGQRIAVAQDIAFGFSYPHMLADWRAQGAEILPFSPLADEAPEPNADAIFLPGGYPELHAATLTQATRFAAGMRAAASRGATIHGECGGYMVLGTGLVDVQGIHYPMLGLLDVETSFAARKLHLGYRRMTPRIPLPWGRVFRGHEFHYATILQERGEPLFTLHDSMDTDLGPAGLRDGRITGTFAHIVEPMV